MTEIINKDSNTVNDWLNIYMLKFKLNRGDSPVVRVPAWYVIGLCSIQEVDNIYFSFFLLEYAIVNSGDIGNLLMICYIDYPRTSLPQLFGHLKVIFVNKIYFIHTEGFFNISI